VGTCLPRTELVTSIQHKLNVDQPIPVVALVGMSGVGKTMLARMVSKQHTGSLVWELSTHNLSSLNASFKDLADGLAKTVEQKKELAYINNLNNGDAKDRKLLSFVKEALLKEKDWLLIFDNVDSLSDINAYIPLDPKNWGKGKVILTTCNSNLQHAYFLPKENIVEVQELSPEESLELFITTVCGSRSVGASERLEIAEFLKHIPPFPLDISVTAQYILHNQITYSDYLERMQQQGFHETQENLLKEMHQHSHSRHHLMRLSIQHVLETQPEFVDLFLMICMLDAAHIPRVFLESSKSKLIVDNFMLQMKKYSLIHQDSDAINIKTFSIPKVTQDIGMQYLSEFIGTHNFPHRKLAIIQLIEHVVQSVLDAEDNEYLKLQAPHLKRLIAAEDISVTTQAALKCLLGCTYYYLGNVELTIQLIIEAVPQLESTPLGQELKIAMALSCLGDSLRNKGKYDESMKSLETSLKIYSQKENMSIHHARTLTYLGNTYRAKGSYGKAKTVLQQSIDIYKQHPHYFEESAQPLGVLSTICRDLGEYKAARDLMEKSLSLYKEQNKYLMWYIGISLCLGSTYTALGDPQKAQSTLEKCDKLIHTSYSEQHPLYPWILIYLGDSLRHQGQFENAQKALEQGIHMFETRFGDKNLGYAIGLSRAGAIYLELDNLNKATQLLKQSYQLLENNFGKDHFQLGYPLYLLGRVMFKNLDLDHAESSLKTSLELYTQVNHTDMHYPLAALAEVFAERAKKEKEHKNIPTALLHEQQARNYLTRALNIVKERCIENSSHEQKILTLQKKLKLN
jgi:tetratricopeptide (TPR) repeat protein